MQPYRDILALGEVRRVFALAFAIRLPMFAIGIVLTLHVVSTLGRSYGEAGLVSAAFTIALALSAPWRGRLLDRYGLRRTLAPSIVVTGLLWTAMPFLPYAVLLPGSIVAGAFAVPSFSILRQALIVVVPEERRRSALSLDSVFTELSFMIGPAVAVWAAATYDTRWVLLILAIANTVAAVVLFLADPAMTVAAADAARSTAAPPLADRDPRSSAAHPACDGEPADGIPAGAQDQVTVGGAGGGVRAWITPGALAVYAAAAASTIVLAGTDVAIVAALRQMGQATAIGWVLSLWGLGSLIGGLAYGAMHRSISVFWLLGGLAITTLPVGLATGMPMFVVLVTLCGVLCAPTITATVDHLSRIVPERFRGEAMGWHGSAMTGGQALGAPLAGYAIDHLGWGWGFIGVSIIGLVVAIAGSGAIRARRQWVARTAVLR
jgi:MFS family permease